MNKADRNTSPFAALGIVGPERLAPEIIELLTLALRHGATDVPLALRVLPASIPSLEELGLPAVVATLAALPRGLVLITGPTGSGKSTALAAIIDVINMTQCKH